MKNVLALTWLEHRRTTGLCNALNLELIALETRLPGALRHMVLSVRTAALLLRRRPALLLVQNPSLVLSGLAVALRPLLGYRLIVDAHNEAVGAVRQPAAVGCTAVALGHPQGRP